MDFRPPAYFASLLALLSVLTLTCANADPPLSQANKTILGPNVYVFDPSMPAADIQSTCSSIFAKMETAEFSSDRYALLFKPGTYNVDFNVGFYTEVAGLGLSPDDVQIDGGVNVNAKWDPHGNALVNFWRDLENYATTPTPDPKHPNELGVTQIAVSQASPVRRLHIKGDLELFDFGPAGNAGYASGGFLADSVIDGQVIAGSQQQWLARNSTWAHWSNAVWNMVFVGCENAPQGQFPNPAYTVIEKTPVIQEKPFLVVDNKGRYRIFVPDLATDRQGVSWANSPTRGTTMSIDRFYIAYPGSATASSINAALTAGKNVLFTPGVYTLDDTVRVTHPKTIVLGLGVPSLEETNGKPIISVDDVGGVKIAGLILDAGPIKSKRILQVGPVGSRASHLADPTFLYDLSIRTGGAVEGHNDVGVEINSNDVVVDQMWIWRADHGAGVGWAANLSNSGLVVNGNNVTCYGLFNEHHEGYQTLWNGNGGRVYMYQSEMPYDIPNQYSWMDGQTNGFASYKVANTVTTHEAWGVGVYCYFRDAAVRADSAIEAPATPGVKFHNMTTIWLDGQPGSEISHIINDVGGTVSSHNSSDAMRQTLNGSPTVGQ